MVVCDKCGIPIPQSCHKDKAICIDCYEQHHLVMYDPTVRVWKLPIDWSEWNEEDLKRIWKSQE